MEKVKVIRGATDIQNDRLPLYLWDDVFTVIEHMPTYSVIMSTIDSRTFSFKNDMLIKIED